MLRRGNRTRTGLRLQNLLDVRYGIRASLTSANGNDHELGSFVQSYGSKWLDGSLLLLPTTVFCQGLQSSAVRFAETIGAATGGRIKIEVFPSGALVRPFETFDAFHVIRFMAS
jgi:hypothetical protein